MSNELPSFKFALREDLKNETINFLPTKGEPDATGYDVRAAQEDRKPIIIQAGQYFKIPLGFRAFCPKGWAYEVHPRSSSFIKKNVLALIGEIDECFPLEVAWVGLYHPDVKSLNTDLVINFGDAIAQMIPFKRENIKISNISNEEIEELYKNRNAVRTGGFGSTSK